MEYLQHAFLRIVSEERRILKSEACCTEERSTLAVHATKISSIAIDVHERHHVSEGFCRDVPQGLYKRVGKNGRIPCECSLFPAAFPKDRS